MMMMNDETNDVCSHLPASRGECLVLVVMDGWRKRYVTSFKNALARRKGACIQLRLMRYVHIRNTRGANQTLNIYHCERARGMGLSLSLAENL
jgi:hypothetical protein